ncbi:MAG: hypothetical protein JSR83_03890 [Proteobacteria bacterium]|nr:hypothetical protein [Pseudomonadota bacterium]
MATLPESAIWPPGIYQLEKDDVVEGGPGGIDNLQPQQLANRTVYLKALLDAASDRLGSQTLIGLAALVTAANQMIYSTGPGTFALNPLTAFIRGLLDDPDAATARGTLGLGSVATLASSTDGTMAANSDGNIPTEKAIRTYVSGVIAAQDVMVFKGVVSAAANPNYPAADCGHTYRISAAGKIGGAAGLNVEVGDILLCLTDGTATGTQAAVGANWNIIQANLDGALLTTALGVTVQAYNANLAAIAALASAADKLPYATGANTWSLTALTAFARTLLAAADAATALTTLGAAPAASPTLTGNIYQNGSVRGGVSAMAAADIDCSVGNYFTKTIAANTTFTFSNVPAGAYSMTLELTHTSGTITLPAAGVWSEGYTPIWSTGKTHLIMAVTKDGGGRWRYSALPNYTT